MFLNDKILNELPFPYAQAKSQAMKFVISLARRVAPYPTTILITGETGVGKEVLASFIHQHSDRANQPFIKINCGAIPESLLESELFGYEPGAFTGARREGAQGLFEAANHGTILLDEVSELPPKAQSKLLRALQEREVRRVGGTWSKTVDVRVISSTNMDLKKMVQHGEFRQDLYYRLQVVQLAIPPLRQRTTDIEELLAYYLDKLGQDFKLSKTIAPGALEKLIAYPWPGNVRELRNLVEYLLITTDGNVIEAKDLPLGLGQQQLSPGIRPLREVVEHAERQAILAVLSQTSNTQQAADALEINYTTLMRKIQKLRIRDEANN